MAHGDDLGAVVAGGGEDEVGANHVLVEELAADEAGGVRAEVGQDDLGVGLHGGTLMAPGARALHDQAAAERVAEAAHQGMAGQPLGDR